MEASTLKRGTVVTFRVNPRERRELDLLARAEGATRSELLRTLIEDRAENITRGDNNRQGQDDA